MKGTIVFIIIFIGLVSKFNAQINLVPNSSFEDTTQCPYTSGQTLFAIPWYDPTNGSSDYFNSCNNSAGGYVGVPNNAMGHQPAHFGSGYVGLYTYYSGFNGREYIQVRLDSVLQSGKNYYVEFYVNLGDTFSIAANNIGMHFSDTAVNGSPGAVLNLIPQLNNNIVSNPLTNKSSWTKISGNFIANGTEHFITIGNFLNDTNTDTTHVPGGSYQFSYYFIDDVSVICTDCDIGIGINENHISTEFNIYPNPVTDRLFIEGNFNEKEFVITDLIGKEITRLMLENGKAQVDVSEFKNGIYFIKSSDTAKKFVVLR